MTYDPAATASNGPAKYGSNLQAALDESKKLWNDLDGDRLIAAASGLQLIPDNAPFLLRFRRMTAVGLRLSAEERAKRLSSSQIKSALATELVSGSTITSKEDPYEGIYVTEIPFFGGPRLVLQGADCDAALNLEILLHAIFADNHAALPQAFVMRVRALSDFVLEISDTICRRAGLQRGDHPNLNTQKPIVPSAQRIEELSNIVTFHDSELFVKYPKHVQDYLLEKLVQQREHFSDWQPDKLYDQRTVSRPILRSADRLILLAPADLLTNLLDHIVKESHTFDCSEALAKALLDVFAMKAQELAGESGGPWKMIGQGHAWKRFTRPLDGDKHLELICVSDDLSPGPAQMWESYKINEEINAHLVECAENEQWRDGVRLLLIHGVGRSAFIALQTRASPMPHLSMSLGDLQTILTTPGFDEMGLLYYARSHDILHKRTRLISTSAVDEFSFYKDHDNSFYLGDDERPTALVLEVGMGQSLRVDNYLRTDRRWIYDSVQNALVECYSVHGPTNSPVYYATKARYPSLVVCLEDRNIWLRLNASEDNSPPASIVDLAENIGYWLWKISTTTTFLQPFESSITPLILTVKYESTAEAFFSYALAEPGLPTKAFADLFYGPVPDGDIVDGAQELDRQLVEVLLTLLREYHQVHNTRQGHVSGLQALTEDVLSQGGKMVQVYTPSTHPLEHPVVGREVRFATPAVTSMLLDELGEHLTQSLSLKVGPVAMGERTNFLNTTVTKWYKDKLAHEMAALDIVTALPDLLHHDEALIAETTRYPITLSNRISAFGPHTDEVERLSKDHTRSVATSVANRFLIEYMVAVPPRGDSPLTVETYDRLISIASEIINKGMLSDAIHSRLADSEISILPSGRLGISREDTGYYRAINRLNDHIATTVLSTATAPTDASAGVSPTPKASPVQAADSVIAAEFGFSFTELADSISVLIQEISHSSTPDMLIIGRVALQKLITEQLTWSEEKYARWFDRLSLAPLDDSAGEFWDQKDTDVRPWRFNRDRSYMRRPLLIRNHEDTIQVLCGRRRLYQTLPFWYEVYSSGRLQATSKELKTALAKIRKDKGDDFERKVHQVAIDAGLHPIRLRVRRIAKYDFRKIDGQDLGDIDVLGVDQPRKTVYLMEAKGLSIARTPAELAREYRDLVEGSKSATSRSSLRARWVQTHLSTVLTELGVTSGKGRWRVDSMIVVDEKLMTSEMTDPEHQTSRILDLTELASYLRK